MTLTDKQDYLRRVYYRAVNKGIIERQQDFADALGIARTSLSSAMNGAERALTKNLYEKVKMWAQLHGVDDEQQKEESKPAGETFEVPVQFQKTLEDLAAVLRLQAEQIARYEAGGGYRRFNGLGGPKKDLTDRD